MSRLEQALERAAQQRGKPEMHQEQARILTQPPSDAAMQLPETTAPPTVDPAAIGNPFLVTVTDPTSPIAEEYRKLRSVIKRLTKRDRYLNTLMVTSAVKSEGKSITALNLALALAQEYDHTILLVDADVRKPSLHEYLRLPGGAGLTDCLTNRADLPSALVRTGIGKLSFLPSGKGVSDPSELLSSNRMKHFVSEIRNRYHDRYIIIDAPPVLSCSETLSMSQMVDGIIFVVMEGLASFENIQEALGMLKDANVLGTIFNNASEAFGTAYGRYYQRYGQPAEAGAVSM